MMLTDMKIPDEAYCQNRLWYNIVCSQTAGTADGVAQGGVSLVGRERPEVWSVESMRFHGPNVMIYEIVSGRQRTLLIGVSLPLFTLYHFPDLEEAINRFQWNAPIIKGDLKAVIRLLQNLSIQHEEYFLESFGMVNLPSHFRQRLRFRHTKMWWNI